MTDTPIERRRPATIIEVAKHAGVSVGTVSRFLNGYQIRPLKRTRVEDAIKLLRYNRNAVAKAMRTERTNLVALLVPGYDEFFAGMLTHLTRGLASAGQVLLTHQHDGDPRTLALALEFFQAHRVNAIVAPGVEDVAPQVEALIHQGIPVVFYNNDVPGLAVDRVFSDNAEASRRAVSYLIDLGHRRIGMLSGDLRETTGQERLKGYQRALEDAGLPRDPRYVCGDSWRRQDADHAIRRLMELEAPPTAVFTANYELAFAVLDYLKERNLTPGEDLSLVSFDDVEVFRQLPLGVTAVAQPAAEIGEQISNIVLGHLRATGPTAPQTKILSCRIVLRNTSRPPRTEAAAARVRLV